MVFLLYHRAKMTAPSSINAISVLEGMTDGVGTVRQTRQYLYRQVHSSRVPREMQNYKWLIGQVPMALQRQGGG